MNAVHTVRRDSGVAARLAELEEQNRNLQLALVRKSSALQHANEELEAFAMLVGHDFRTPLFSVMGFTSELERLRDIMLALWTKSEPTSEERDRLTAEIHEAFGYVNGGTTKMAGMIDATLAMLRASRGEVNHQTVETDALVRSVAGDVHESLSQREGTMLVAPLPSVVSDPDALRDVFSHLLCNAAKFLRDDVPYHIEVEAELGADSVIFNVHDNGRGIAEGDQRRIFQLFRRVAPFDRPGQGLGLSHARAILRRLGGTLRVRSELGFGSVFSIELPLVKRPSASSGMRAAVSRIR